MARSIAHVKNTAKPAKVSVSRWIAWRTVLRVFDQQAYIADALKTEAERVGADDRDIRQAQRLSHGTVQSAKTLDYIIAEVGKRPLKKIDSPLLNAIRLGLYELLYLDGADHAAVSDNVEIVRATLGERPVPFANALLRRGQARYEEILTPLSNMVEDIETADSELLATWLSYPTWIVDTMRDAWGTDGILLLAAQNPDTPPVPAPGWHQQLTPLHELVGVRLNTLLGTDAAATQMAAVATSHTIAAEVGPEAAVIRRDDLPEIQALIADRQVIRQAVASQLVVHLLDPQPGERVLDMCSAPGGKAVHMAARMNNTGELVCLEKHEARSRALLQSLTQCGVTNHTVKAMPAQAFPIAEGGFDRVLVDAPCSGLGVMAKRPDLRFNRSQESIGELAGLQRELLTHALKLATPTGTIAYATCTLTPQENTDVVRDVLESTPWRVQSERVLMPHRDLTDGFYVAIITHG